jgi:hypothetical protein
MSRQRAASRGLKVGDVAYGLVTGYPWWPCHIDRFKGEKAYVYFFGATVGEECAWVHRELGLRPFNLDDLLPIERNLYEQQLKIAVKDAKTYLGTHVESDLCYKCKNGGFLVLCDECSNSGHLECEGLKDIPEGPFLCSVCLGDDDTDQKQCLPSLIG